MNRIITKWIHRIAVALTFVASVSAATDAQAQVVRDFTEIYSTTSFADMALIGNTLETCRATDPGCTTARSAGSAKGNDDFDMEFVDTDSDTATMNASEASLNMPFGATVLYARLYWGGRTKDSDTPLLPNRGKVSVKAPSSASYQVIQDSSIDAFDDATIGVPSELYMASADVTELVTSAGSGKYTIANVQASKGNGGTAGWSLVVVYESWAEPLRNITLFDGYAKVDNFQPVEIDIAGFLTPLSGTFTAELGFVSIEGDLKFSGDGLQLIRGGASPVTLSNSLRPSNNFFNSTITDAATHFTSKTPNYVNQMGWDSGTIDISSLLGNDQDSATIKLLTNSDTYGPSLVAFSSEVYEPQIVIEKTVTDVNGGYVEDDDVLQYSLHISNEGLDAAINVVLSDELSPKVNFVPGSLRISEGANSGNKSDADDSDQAEYRSSARYVEFRLGTGANGTRGGTLDAGEVTSVQFQVRIDFATKIGTEIVNQAFVSFEAATTGEEQAELSDSDLDTFWYDPTVITIERNIDSDDDGLPDFVEDSNNDGQLNDSETDRYDDDTDDDGVMDGTEDENRNGRVDDGEGDPRDADSDDDGLLDGLELGLSEPEGEDTDLSNFIPDADGGESTTDPTNWDTDGGTISDGVEDTNQNGQIDGGERSPNIGADDLSDDCDNDGLTNEEEYELGTDPCNPDSDGDGIPDPTEGEIGSDPLEFNGTQGGGASCSSTGSSLPSGIGLVAAFAVAALSRRRRKLRRTVGAAALTSVAAVGSAQAADVQLQEGPPRLDVQRFDPIPQFGGFLRVREAELPKAPKFGVTVSTNYSLHPYELGDTNYDRVVGIVDNLIGADIGLALAPADWISLGLAVPVAQYQWNEFNSDTLQQALGAAGAGYAFGDTSFEVTLQALRQTELGSPVSVAITPRMWLPSGSGERFVGSGSVGIGVDAEVGGRWEHFRFALNAGLHKALKPQTFLDVRTGDELRGALGLGFPINEVVELQLETTAATVYTPAFDVEQVLSSFDRRLTPIELHGAVQIHPSPGVRLTLGGGPGFGPGVGAPDARAFLSASFAMPNPKIITAKPPPPPPPPKREAPPPIIAEYQPEQGRIFIYWSIYFELDRATIQPESYEVINAVVKILEEHPEIRLLEIQGHTDDQGEDDYNLQLSQRRTEAVRRYMIEDGISPSRLTSRGFGESQPLDPSTSEDARAKNRRVEFIVLEME